MTDLLTPSELAGLRTDVEQIFSYECNIFKDEGLGVLNTSTGEYDAQPADSVLYNGPYLLKPIISRRDRFDEFGEGLVFTRQYRVVIPYTESDIKIRNVFQAVTSDDPQLVGRPMLVRDVMVGTHVGYRRLTVQDTKE